MQRTDAGRQSKGPGIGLPPWKEALHDSSLFNILMECWSNGVLEKQNPTLIFCNFKQRSLGFFVVAYSSRAIDHHSSTPMLHHSLKLLQAEPIISDSVH